MSRVDFPGVPRTYRLSELGRDLGSIALRVPALWSIWVGDRLPKALREQVIVAVAQVNACRMCAHAHSRLALEAGVSDAELAALESLDAEAFDRRTWLAIAHAQERTRANFDTETDDARRALTEALGDDTRQAVEDVARVMTIANRIANTLNALPDRVRGHAVPGSRLFDEIIVSLLFLPGAWLGTLIAAVRQRKSPFEVWRRARGR